MGASLSEKVAIVTGGGSGVGCAYAHALADAGATVVISDPGSDAEGTSTAEIVAKEIEARGGKGLADQTDVADFSAVGQMVEKVIAAYGRIDILICNAGVIRPTFMFEAEESDWTNVLAVHANGTFNCYRHVVPHMMSRNSGSIINTGAGLMQGHFPKNAAYRAAKAAILELTISTSIELKDYNINVNSIMPGPTLTPMALTYLETIPDPEMAKQAKSMLAPPESVPPLGVYLCSDDARPITGLSFYITEQSGFSVANSMGELTPITANHGCWAEGELKERLPDWLASVMPDDLYQWRG